MRAAEAVRDLIADSLGAEVPGGVWLGWAPQTRGEGDKRSPYVVVEVASEDVEHLTSGEAMVVAEVDVEVVGPSPADVTRIARLVEEAVEGVNELPGKVGLSGPFGALSWKWTARTSEVGPVEEIVEGRAYSCTLTVRCVGRRHSGWR